VYKNVARVRMSVPKVKVEVTGDKKNEKVQHFVLYFCTALSQFQTISNVTGIHIYACSMLNCYSKDRALWINVQWKQTTSHSITISNNICSSQWHELTAGLDWAIFKTSFHFSSRSFNFSFSLEQIKHSQFQSKRVTLEPKTEDNHHHYITQDNLH